MVKALVENTQDKNAEDLFDDSTEVGSEVSKEDLERTLNVKTPAAAISVRMGQIKFEFTKL